MYPFLSTLAVLLGAALLAAAGAAKKKSGRAAAALCAAGALLTIAGLTALFLLLTGRVARPLAGR